MKLEGKTAIVTGSGTGLYEDVPGLRNGAVGLVQEVIS